MIDGCGWNEDLHTTTDLKIVCGMISDRLLGAKYVGGDGKREKNLAEKEIVSSRGAALVACLLHVQGRSTNLLIYLKEGESSAANHLIHSGKPYQAPNAIKCMFSNFVIAISRIKYGHE